MFGSISIDSMPPSSSNGMPQADTFGWEQANNNTFAQESVPEFQHHPRNSDNQSACSTSATESDDTECSSKHHSQVLDWLANVDSTQDDKHTTAKGIRLPLFNSRGLTPCKCSKAYALRVMEESATQPSSYATQQVRDPRRDGSKSLMSQRDEADVLCILLPSSGPALRAVDLIYQTAPQHILTTEPEALPHEVDGEDMEYEQSSEEDISPQKPTRFGEEENDAPTEGTSQDTQRPFEQTQTVRNISRGPPSRDIALRMTSTLHDPCMGFTFGRSAKRCDLLLNNDSAIRISNLHFRIFLNRHGIPMLEDMSTNGTLVDKVLLRSDRAGKHVGTTMPTRSLQNGAMIELPIMTNKREETIRFIVRFPSRGQQQEVYNERLAQYLEWIQQTERQKKVAMDNKSQMPPPPVLPFNPLKDRAAASPNASMLAAATGDSNHGLGWNGGDKYNVVKPIGKGAFALVFQLSAKVDGEVYACKQIEKRRFIKDGILNNKAHNEIMVMKELEHPNIVKYHEYYESKAHIFIIMEFVHFGDLSTYTEAGNAMAEFMCQAMAQQILEALHYLHSKLITHRDIKPDNILISNSNPYVFKLSDFGLSKMVRNEETFLKSFCGTLLYCAPEIYPGFHRARLGLHPSKRTRSSEPRKGTQPYEHSVDIWSIAAVLFHLLCGHAPYTGSMENEGYLMLMSIMRSSPNWEYLRQAGISKAGIDFVRKALVVDPQERARETDLLKHPWLTGQDDETMDYAISTPEGTEAEVLDASQLSLQDIGNAQDDLENERQAKRSKIFHQSEDDAPIDLFGGVNREDWFGGSAHQWQEGSSDHAAGHVQNGNADGLGSNRLFGEIGSSALRSSGVFGGNAQAALGMQTASSRDPSANESFGQPHTESLEGLSFAHPNLTHNQAENADDATSQQELQYPRVLPSKPYAGIAPSLEGAEALVDQMNMDSPRSDISPPSGDSKPTTPKTPQHVELPQHQVTPGRSVFASKQHSNNVTPRAPSGRNAEDRRSHQAGDDVREWPNHSASGLGSKRPGSSLGEGIHGSSNPSHASHVSQSSDNDAADGQSIYPKLPSMPSTSSNSHESELQDPTDVMGEDELDEQVPDPPTDNDGNVMPGFPPLMKPLAQSSAANSAKPEHVFAKPMPRYGILIPTPGSVTVKPIRLEQRATSYGRDPKCTVVFEDSQDTRVSKSALNIAFWYQGIERDIAKGKTNWHRNPHLRATISTRTNTYIKINGIHLMKSQEGKAQFGFLSKCDMVEVFCSSDRKEYLQFRCDFFVGQSRKIRGPNDPFKVFTKSLDDKPKESPSVTTGSRAEIGLTAQAPSFAGPVKPAVATSVATTSDGKRAKSDENEVAVTRARSL